MAETVVLPLRGKSDDSGWEMAERGLVALSGSKLFRTVNASESEE
jgi:hypothetical protein